MSFRKPSVLGGSWVVINRVMSARIWLISIVTLLTTPLFSLPVNLQHTLNTVEPRRTLKGTL